MHGLQQLEPEGLGCVAEQVVLLLSGEAEGHDDRDLNPVAIKLIRRHLGGLDQELDEAIGCYFAKGL